MREPHVSTKFHHHDWDVTFVIWAYRIITKVKAALAVTSSPGAPSPTGPCVT